MITDQQLVINNLEEKLKLFTKAVSGELINEEDFILANTEVPTDTFNILVSKNPNIKNVSKVRQDQIIFIKKSIPLVFGWMIVTQVKSKEELSKYIEVFISLFEGTPEQYALEDYFNKFSQKKLGLDTQLFIGCIDKVAVTTGLLIKSQDSYGIYDVMTKENFQGKGLGSEMFQFLLNQTNDKEKPVVLQASDDGKNIYKRFGFIDVGEMVVFE